MGDGVCTSHSPTILTTILYNIHKPARVSCSVSMKGGDKESVFSPGR